MWLACSYCMIEQVLVAYAHSSLFPRRPGRSHRRRLGIGPARAFGPAPYGSYRTRAVEAGAALNRVFGAASPHSEHADGGPTPLVYREDLLRARGGATSPGGPCGWAPLLGLSRTGTTRTCSDDSLQQEQSGRNQAEKHFVCRPLALCFSLALSCF